MYPSPVSSVGARFSSENRDFTSQFFDLSQGISHLQQNPKVVAYLKILEALKCTIDKEKVVFGEGTSWPLINIDGIYQVHSSLAIGSRGSMGYSNITLEKYLERQCETAMQARKSQTTQQESLPSTRPSSTTSTTSTSRYQATFAPNSIPDYNPLSTKPNYNPLPTKPKVDNTALLMQMFGGGNNCFVGGAYNLRKLNDMGIFCGPPGKAANSLTANQLVGCELIVFHDNTCLIRQANHKLPESGTILALSEGLTLLEQDSKGFYIHGINKYDDVPCKKTVQLRTNLKLPLVEEILPYLNAIPAFPRVNSDSQAKPIFSSSEGWCKSIYCLGYTHSGPGMVLDTKNNHSLIQKLGFLNNAEGFSILVEIEPKKYDAFVDLLNSNGFVGKEFDFAIDCWNFSGKEIPGFYKLLLTLVELNPDNKKSIEMAMKDRNIAF